MRAATRPPRPARQEIENRICNIIAEQMGLRRDEVSPQSRLIQDLNCDSLDFIEVIMEIEDAFDAHFPDHNHPLSKTVFTRHPFRISDFADLVEMFWGTGRPERSRMFRAASLAPHRAHPPVAPFTQLGGRDSSDPAAPLHESLGVNERGHPVCRRVTDGMTCVLSPGATARIGDDSDYAQPDEKPVHPVSIEPMLIDVEPVSVLAYTRFLNSVQVADPRILRDWFMLDESDRRREHELLEFGGGAWRVRPGVCEAWPMILVSWHGANAYALWANRMDHRRYDGSAGEPIMLPTEAQWEFAARGTEPQRYPWGGGDAAPHFLRAASHERGRRYALADLPLASVNEPLGVSWLGLRHMAGNVWQWCRDWYEPEFYARTATAAVHPGSPGSAWNRTPTGVRSERGGSWVGGSDLARSSYRRARSPLARGRCLGFRCVGQVVGQTM